MFKLKRPPKTNTGWSLDQRDPRFIESMMPVLGLLYNCYFRVQTSGWENVPDEKILIMGDWHPLILR
jgi:1-acyl-sn-glycerol-3-phosphate acyltransferase